MSTASRGAAREHQVKRLMEDKGFAVTRGAGSHGCADLWAAKVGPNNETDLWLIQVKGNAGSPFKTFCPKDREELIALADQTGGVPWLVHWAPGKERRWLPERYWPKPKLAES